MAINIKNEAAVALVRRVAERYGTDYTTAIKIASEAALSQAPASERKAANVRRIAAEYRAHLPEGHSLNTDDLYGEDGLPA